MTAGTGERHTPTPWRCDEFYAVKGPDGKAIVLFGFAMTLPAVQGGRPADDTRFVIRAVNAHDDMLAALQKLTTEITQSSVLMDNISLAIFDEAIDAIAKATEPAP